MQRRLIVFFVLVLGVLLALGFAFDRRRVSVDRLDDAIERGAGFVAAAWSPFHFADPYLAFVYPGESLTCGLPNCRVTYRTLDAYFALHFLQPRLQAKELRRLEAPLGEAQQVLADLAPRWVNVPIENALKSSASDGGVALDTYCILGTVEQSAPMAQHLLEYLTEDNNFIDDQYYQDDRWRNIADETWCLRLLAETGSSAPLDELLTRQAEQAKTFLSNDENAAAKSGVAYHLLMLDEAGKGSESDRLMWQEEIVNLLRSSQLDGDSISLGNALEVLSESGYSDREFLALLANYLLALQGKDGAWRVNNEYPAFSTLRALNGLAAYRRLQP